MAVLLGVGMDRKILIRRQFFHVTILQDYLRKQVRLSDHITFISASGKLLGIRRRSAGGTLPDKVRRYCRMGVSPSRCFPAAAVVPLLGKDRYFSSRCSWEIAEEV